MRTINIKHSRAIGKHFTIGCAVELARDAHHDYLKATDYKKSIYIAYRDKYLTIARILKANADRS